jgi:N-acetylmuramoyl-L-alanine amidase
MRFLAAVPLFTVAFGAAGWAAPAGLTGLTSIRVSTAPLEVVIESTAPLTFRQGRLSNPSRAYFDFTDTELRLSGNRYFSVDGDGTQVTRVRAAETTPGTVRVVFDLAGDGVRLAVSTQEQPARLVVTVKPGGPATPPPPQISLDQMRSGAREAATTGRIPAPPAAVPEVSSPAAGKLREADKKTGQGAAEKLVANRKVAAAPGSRTEPATPLPQLAETKSAGLKSAIKAAETPAPTAASDKPRLVARSSPPASRAEEDLLSGTARPALEADGPSTPGPEPSVGNGAAPALPAVGRLPPAPPSNSLPGASPTPARRGSRSLTRALGLKLGRIVLDPGHGGNDFGTSSANGLHEKELVLDVAKRLGQLLEEQLGSEVIYTRDDDRFVSLERRTEFANEQKADLFISIHANSSPFKQAAGPETYFLNFTSTREALEVASRENASSGKTIFELKDLLQKIALNEKLTESRDFAAKVQSSMIAMTKGAAPQRDRGVKRAPFVVLIGAQMPSILSEIGFVSNPREEALLKRSEYRQKIAEALAKGIVQYATSLSRFQVAQATRATQ